MEYSIPRLVIAAAKSGSGKTTIVSGLLSALRQKGMLVQSYKVGPDYIDPGYHSLATGKPCHNLDSWLMPKETMRNIFINNAQTSDMAVIEGVMGLYDGGREGISSTAEIAKLLDAPVVLVIDCKSMGASAAALAMGFREYDRSVQLAGVILNRIGSENHERIIREALENINIPVLGAVKRNDDFRLPERHLGLLPVTENREQRSIFDWGNIMAGQLNLAEIIAVARKANTMSRTNDKKAASEGSAAQVKIGIARDEAFSFYYPESIRVLEETGAEIVEFSPLNDNNLPKVDGLIFGGGFPEMFGDKLASNENLIQSIKRMAGQGMPIYGECGGFMYLSKSLEDFDGNIYPMCGILPCEVKMNNKLQMVGYVSAEMTADCILGKKGDIIRGHEFHFSMEIDKDRQGKAVEERRAFSFVRTRNGAQYYGGYSQNNVLASYLHLHFAGCPTAARSFVEKCLAYKNKMAGKKGI